MMRFAIPLLAMLRSVQCNDWDQCTSVIVGPKASVDGSTYATHTNDCVECDFRVVHIPSRDHTPGSTRKIWPYKAVYPREIGTDRSPQYDESAGLPASKALGEIPEVDHTFAYWEGTYPYINEHGLGFGESTTFFKIWSALPKTDNIMYVHEPMRIAMERCKTARCAIQLMGDLSVKYGFYGEGPQTSESVSVVDPTEAWVFQVGNGLNNKSAVWAAQRVPEDHVAVIANGLTIRKVDSHDTDNFMLSENLFDVALKAGFWNGKDDFDFAKMMQQDLMTFKMGPSPIPAYISMRTWRVFDRVAPSLKLRWEMDPLDLPFSVKVDKPLTHRDVMDLMRDHYEGTEYDMRDGIAAGPFRDPNRPEGEKGDGEYPRAIAIPRTSTSIVIQSRPGASDRIGSGGIAWLAVDDPSSSVHVPFYANTGWLNGSPNIYSRGNLFAFSRDSAWWAFNFVANWMMKNYEHMSAVVLPKVQEKQDMIDKAMEEMERKAEAMVKSGASPQQLIEEFQHQIQEKIVSDWWSLADYLIMRFSDLVDNKCIDAGGPPTGDVWKLSCKVGVPIPFPTWYLDQTGYDHDQKPHWMSSFSLSPPESFKDTSPDRAPWLRMPGSWDGKWPADPTDHEVNGMSPVAIGIICFGAGLLVGVLLLAMLYAVCGRRRAREVIGQDPHGMSMTLATS